MTHPDLLHDMARQTQRERHAEAATVRLARIAQCCKPSTLAQLWRTARCHLTPQAAGC